MNDEQIIDWIAENFMQFRITPHGLCEITYIGPKGETCRRTIFPDENGETERQLLRRGINEINNKP